MSLLPLTRGRLGGWIRSRLLWRRLLRRGHGVAGGGVGGAGADETDGRDRVRGGKYQAPGLASAVSGQPRRR